MLLELLGLILISYFLLYGFWFINLGLLVNVLFCFKIFFEIGRNKFEIVFIILIVLKILFFFKVFFLVVIFMNMMLFSCFCV